MYSRIVIFGRPGSGKSAFAFYLSTLTKLSLYHLDHYFFPDNWREGDYQDFLNIQQQLVKQNFWIIDGNNTRSPEMRYSRANLVLSFNYPRSKRHYRIFKRLFVKNKNILDKGAGCKEKIRWSLLYYTWIFHKRIIGKIHNLRQSYPGVTFIEICYDLDLKTLLNSQFT